MGRTWFRIARSERRRYGDGEERCEGMDLTMWRSKVWDFESGLSVSFGSVGGGNGSSSFSLPFSNRSDRDSSSGSGSGFFSSSPQGCLGCEILSSSSSFASFMRLARSAKSSANVDI